MDIFTEEVVDVVITDRAMGGMSGDQVAAVVKKQRPGTPVILLTGFGDIMKSKQEMPDDVDLILGKPITPNDLAGALIDVLPARDA